jgi:hypothetical protein
MTYQALSRSKPGTNILYMLVKVLFGLILPFLIEIFVYIIYTGLRTQDYQFSALLLFIFLIIPIIFIYIISPRLVFFFGGVKRHISNNLKNNLESVFLKPRRLKIREKAVPLEDMAHILKDKEIKLLKNKIETRVIPDLLTEARKQYSQNFVDRGNRTRNERLLTYNEALFLFSGVTSLLLFMNLILVLILQGTSIKLDFIELDQISNSTNVLIFALVFGVLLFCGIFLFFTSSRTLCRLIPRIVPIVYYEPEAERERRLIQILSIAEFPISNLFVRRTQKELSGIIYEAKKSLLLTQLVETISWYYRDEMAKSIAWKLYKEVLEEIQIPDEAKEKIEKQFKYDPLLQIISSQILTSEEEQAIKADLDYIQEKIAKWDKIRSEEQTLSFLLIYRTLETVFRKTLTNLFPELEKEEVNFIKLIDILERNSLITKDAASLLHEIRFKRNVLFHEPGKSLDLGKDTMNKLLYVIKETIDKAEEK